MFHPIACIVSYPDEIYLVQISRLFRLLLLDEISVIQPDPIHKLLPGCLQYITDTDYVSCSCCLPVSDEIPDEVAIFGDFTGNFDYENYISM